MVRSAAKVALEIALTAARSKCEGSAQHAQGSTAMHAGCRRDCSAQCDDRTMCCHAITPFACRKRLPCMCFLTSDARALTSCRVRAQNKKPLQTTHSLESICNRSATCGDTGAVSNMCAECQCDEQRCCEAGL